MRLVLAAALLGSLAGARADIPFQQAWGRMDEQEHLWFMAVPGTSSSQMEQTCRTCRHPHHSVMHRLHAPPSNDTAFFGRACASNCTTRAQLPARSTNWLGRSHTDISNADRLRREGKSPLHVMLMMRDPIQWAQRMYQKRILDPSYERRVGKPISQWNEAGEEGLLEWADNAFWKWNFFARALAGDVSSNDLMHSDPAKDDITRERALGHVLAAERGLEQSELYRRARAAMLDLGFLGLFDRLEDTNELLAYTLCWDVDMLKAETGFKVRSQHRGPKLSPQTDAYLRQYNLIDVALYEEARRIFDERFRAMRRAKAAAGDDYVCKFLGREAPCVFRCSGSPADGEL